MMVCVENPKESTKEKKKKFLKLVNQFSKVAAYKINIHRSVTFLYTSNEPLKTKIKNTAFTVAQKGVFRYKSNKTCQDLYAANYKTLIKEIREDLNKWKGVPRSWSGRLNVVKMLVLPKRWCRLDAVPMKVPAKMSVDISRPILNFFFLFEI